MLHKRVIALTAVPLLVAGSALAGGPNCSASSHEASYIRHASLESAVQKAESAGVPVLIKVGAEWCTACQAFDKDVAERADLQKAFDGRAVLYQVDGETGEGVEIARHYDVHAYPSFILTDSKGELMDRWIGYENRDEFLATMKDATSDPLTFTERRSRFSREPNASDAVKLAELQAYEGNYAEAAALFKRASVLDANADYTTAAFKMVAKGAYYGTFEASEVLRHADAVMASSKSEALDYLTVAQVMGKVASKSHDPNHYLPYLQAAIERTNGSKSAEVTEVRTRLLPDYALHVEKDEDKAVALKKASLPEGWVDAPNQLNNFAWWCFENEVNLHEAESLARQAVEMSEPGTMKANILDTLAEICNLKGDCGDAVDIMERAVAEAPDNEYFRAQLKRFEEMLAQQTK